MKIVVREGELGDALSLCRLRRRVWLSCYVCAERGFTKERILSLYRFTDSESVSAMREMLSGGEGGEVGVFVAETTLSHGRSKAVGFVVGERLENRLTMLYVDSVWQGRGVGGMLWERVREFLDGGRDVVLTVVDFNEGAQAFYLRRGFVFDEEVDMQEGCEQEGCESLFASKGMRRMAAGRMTED